MCNGRVQAIGGGHIRRDSTIQTVFVNAAAVFDSGYCTVRLQLKGAVYEQVFSLSKFYCFGFSERGQNTYCTSFQPLFNFKWGRLGLFHRCSLLDASSADVLVLYV